MRAKLAVSYDVIPRAACRAELDGTHRESPVRLACADMLGTLLRARECGRGSMKTSRGIEPKTDVERYDERASAAGLSPLWTFFKDWFSAEPRVSAVPHVWRFDELRPLIMAAADVVSTTGRRATRALAREPRARRPASRDRFSVRGYSADHAGRVRARASGTRPQRCASSSRAETRTRPSQARMLHAARRLHRDAVVELARAP